jgi:hypothetical protein
MAVLNLVGNVVGELLGAAEGAAEGAAVSKSVEPMEPSSALQWVQRSVLLMALQTDSQLDQQTEPWWAMWKVPQTALRLASCGKVTWNLELGINVRLVRRAMCAKLELQKLEQSCNIHQRRLAIGTEPKTRDLNTNKQTRLWPLYNRTESTQKAYDTTELLFIESCCWCQHQVDPIGCFSYL